MHVEGKMIASCTTSLSLIYTYSAMKWSFHIRIPLECGKAHGVKIFSYSDGGAFYHTKVGHNLLECIFREVWSRIRFRLSIKRYVLYHSLYDYISD